MQKSLIPSSKELKNLKPPQRFPSDGGRFIEAAMTFFDSVIYEAELFKKQYIYFI
jgi:hypothetical protein